MLNLVIFPTLAQAAIKQRQAKELWLWTVLRALDQDGRGWVSIEKATEAWQQSNKSLFRTLHLGERVYWNSSSSKIFLRSTYNIGCHLESVLGSPVEVDFDSCCSIGKFKIQCFAAWFWKKRTISVATLANLYGISVSTVQTWTRKSRLHKQENIAFYEPSEDGAGAPTHTNGGVWFSGGICYFQIPNSYCNRVVSLCARHSRTEKRLRNTLNMGKGQYLKLYFDDSGKACRALQAGQNRALVDNKNFRGNKRLWCYYAME